MPAQWRGAHSDSGRGWKGREEPRNGPGFPSKVQGIGSIYSDVNCMNPPNQGETSLCFLWELMVRMDLQMQQKQWGIHPL